MEPCLNEIKEILEKRLEILNREKTELEQMKTTENTKEMEKLLDRKEGQIHESMAMLVFIQHRILQELCKK